MALKKLGATDTEIQVNGSTEFGPEEQSDDSTYDVDVSASVEWTDQVDNFTLENESSYSYNVGSSSRKLEYELIDYSDFNDKYFKISMDDGNDLADYLNESWYDEDDKPSNVDQGSFYLGEGDLSLSTSDCEVQFTLYAPTSSVEVGNISKSE